MPSTPPEDPLDRPLLRQLAGGQSFAHGEQYFTDGRVRQLHVAEDGISAQVNGGRTYRVKLWRRRGELRFRCDCDEGRTETFCKHCVAVGLAWLSQPDQAGEADGPAAAKRDEARREEERGHLSAHLRTLDQDRLVSLLLEATDYDEILRRRLVLETLGIARTPERPGVQGGSRPRGVLAAYRRLLRAAIQPAGSMDFHAMPDYVQGIEEAIAPLAAWLGSGWHEEVIDVVEFVLVELDAASDRADIGDPLLNRVYEDLQRFHLEACRKAVPDVAALASRLLDYELEGGLGIFNNAAQTYAEILGPKGQSSWRALLIREWCRLAETGEPAVRRGATPPPINHRRFQVQMLMERLADSERDQDALLALKRADLRGVRDHVAFAEWLARIGRHEEAIRWAEQASKLFTGRHETQVWREFLIHEYARAGRSEEATFLAWAQFQETGDLEDFRELKNLVLRHDAPRWPDWRDRAVAQTREQAQRTRSQTANAPSTTLADNSRLVEILLEENRADLAWQAASEGGCRDDLWLLLASHRETAHPDEALEIYRGQIDKVLAAAGPGGYREAAELMLRARKLLLRARRSEDYALFLAALRAKHRKKRTFLRLLAAASP